MSNFEEMDSGRESMTPISAAASVLGSLIHIWSTWFPKVDFLDMIFKPMWDDETTSGAEQLKEIKVIEDAETYGFDEPLTPEGREACVKIAVMSAACAFCVQAMKAEKKSQIAWSYTVDASRWLGILQGLISGSGDHRKAASSLGKLGANAAHAENRAMKKLVLDWCDANMASFKSMDAAAESIAGKVVPVKFRTARDWVGEWKKLRSSGKA